MPSVEDEPSQLIYNLATAIVHPKQYSIPVNRAHNGFWS
jgi:hypothetical protein